MELLFKTISIVVLLTTPFCALFCKDVNGSNVGAFVFKIRLFDITLLAPTVNLTVPSTIACTAACLPDPKCQSAVFLSANQTCFLSSEKLPNDIMSPGMQADNFGLTIFYVDFKGYVPEKTKPTTSSTTTTPKTTSTTSMTTTTSVDKTTTTTSMQGLPLIVGDKVVRGLDWQWENQDGHSIGTVLEVLPGWVKVDWKLGDTDYYRNGYEGMLDLAYATLAA